MSASFTGTNVTAAADTSDQNPPIDQAIQFSIANRTAGTTIWHRVTYTGQAVSTSDVVFDSPQSGHLHVVMFIPGQLGAGTYTSSVRVEICTDSTCSTQMTGSPFTVSVSYTVTGSAIPTTKVSWGGLYTIEKELSASQTTPVEEALGFTVQNLPPAGLWVRRRRPSDGIITGATLGTVSFERTGASVTASFKVSMAPPAALGSGIHAGSMEFITCFDSACARPVPDGGRTLNVELAVFAEAPAQFTRRVVTPTRGATDVAWSQANGALYALSSLPVTTTGADVLQVDPATGVIGHSLTLSGVKLGKVAVSDDGTRLFYSSQADRIDALIADARIHRLKLPELVEEAQIVLDPSTDFAFGRTVVTDMVAMPGTSDSVVASIGLYEHFGVHAYDAVRKPDGVPRVSVGWEAERFFSRGPAPDILYSLRHYPLPPFNGAVEKLQMDGNGIRVIQSFPVSIDSREVQYGGGRLFFLDGRVLDADTGAVAGQLPKILRLGRPDALVVDEAHSRVFVISNDWLLSYDMNSYKLLAFAKLGVSNQRATFDHRIMKLWGSDGVAVVDGTNLIIMSGPFFSTYEGMPTMTLAPDAPYF